MAPKHEELHLCLKKYESSISNCNIIKKTCTFFFLPILSPSLVLDMSLIHTISTNKFFLTRQNKMLYFFGLTLYINRAIYLGKVKGRFSIKNILEKEFESK